MSDQLTEPMIERRCKLETTEVAIQAIAMDDGVHLDLNAQPEGYWYPVLCVIIFYAFEPVELLDAVLQRGAAEWDGQIGFAYHGLTSVGVPAGHVACQVRGRRTDVPIEIFDRVVLESLRTLLQGADTFKRDIERRPEVEARLSQLAQLVEG